MSGCDRRSQWPRCQSAGKGYTRVRVRLHRRALHSHVCHSCRGTRQARLIDRRPRPQRPQYGFGIVKQRQSTAPDLQNACYVLWSNISTMLEVEDL